MNFPKISLPFGKKKKTEEFEPPAKAISGDTESYTTDTNEEEVPASTPVKKGNKKLLLIAVAAVLLIASAAVSTILFTGLLKSKKPTMATPKMPFAMKGDVSPAPANAPLPAVPSALAASKASEKAQSSSQGKSAPVEAKQAPEPSKTGKEPATESAPANQIASNKFYIPVKDIMKGDMEAPVQKKEKLILEKKKDIELIKLEKDETVATGDKELATKLTPLINEGKLAKQKNENEKEIFGAVGRKKVSQAEIPPPRLINITNKEASFKTFESGTRRASVGDIVDGWKVASIKGANVTITKGKNTRTLAVNFPSHYPTQSPMFSGDGGKSKSGSKVQQGQRMPTQGNPSQGRSSSFSNPLMGY